MNEAQQIAADQLSGSTDEFSVSELAELLKLHAATIRLWIREERLPSARKDGRKWLIRGADVAELLAETPTLGYAHPRGSSTSVEAILEGERRRHAEVGPRALGTGILDRGLA